VYPKRIFYNNLSFEKTYIKAFKSKELEIFCKNMTPELEKLNNIGEIIHGFNNSDSANGVLEDIINYDVDSLIFTHQLKDVLERLDGIILSIENTHRTVIQKIKTEKLVEKNIFNQSKIKCKKTKKNKKSNHNARNSDSESDSDSSSC
jgi:hypothetical protein